MLSKVNLLLTVVTFTASSQLILEDGSIDVQALFGKELRYHRVLNKKADQDNNLMTTFARKFSNIDFFLNILPLKVDELLMSEM